MLNHKFIKFVFLLIYGLNCFNVYSQNENYQDGQLFVQTRAGLIVDFEESLLKNKKLEPFKIKSIDQAFN